MAPVCVGQVSVFLVPTIFGDPQRGLIPEPGKPKLGLTYLKVTNIKDLAPVCVGQVSVFLVPTIFGGPQRGLTPRAWKTKRGFGLFKSNKYKRYGACVCGPGLCLLGPDDLW